MARASQRALLHSTPIPRWSPLIRITYCRKTMSMSRNKVIQGWYILCLIKVDCFLTSAPTVHYLYCLYNVSTRRLSRWRPSYHIKVSISCIDTYANWTCGYPCLGTNEHVSPQIPNPRPEMRQVLFVFPGYLTESGPVLFDSLSSLEDFLFSFCNLPFLHFHLPFSCLFSTWNGGLFSVESGLLSSVSRYVIAIPRSRSCTDTFCG